MPSTFNDYSEWERYVSATHQNVTDLVNRSVENIKLYSQNTVACEETTIDKRILVNLAKDATDLLGCLKKLKECAGGYFSSISWGNIGFAARIGRAFTTIAGSASIIVHFANPHKCNDAPGAIEVGCTFWFFTFVISYIYEYVIALERKAEGIEALVTIINEDEMLLNLYITASKGIQARDRALRNQKKIRRRQIDEERRERYPSSSDEEVPSKDKGLRAVTSV